MPIPAIGTDKNRIPSPHNSLQSLNPLIHGVALDNKAINNPYKNILGKGLGYLSLANLAYSNNDKKANTQVLIMTAKITPSNNELKSRLA